MAKVLSIKQPYASLIVLGNKKIETRSWSTKYRGELFIHASMKPDANGMDTVSHDLFWQYMKERVNEGEKEKHRMVPVGCIIGKATLYDVLPSSNLLHNMDLNKKDGYAAQYEERYGDYSPNRFGWLLKDPVLFDKPIPAKGMLGIWEYDFADKEAFIL